MHKPKYAVMCDRDFTASFQKNVSSHFITIPKDYAIQNCTRKIYLDLKKTIEFPNNGFLIVDYSFFHLVVKTSTVYLTTYLENIHVMEPF